MDTLNLGNLQLNLVLSCRMEEKLSTHFAASILIPNEWDNIFEIPELRRQTDKRREEKKNPTA